MASAKAKLKERSAAPCNKMAGRKGGLYRKLQRPQHMYGEKGEGSSTYKDLHSAH